MARVGQLEAGRGAGGGRVDIAEEPLENPIDSVDELQALEKKLSDDIDFRAQLVGRFCYWDYSQVGLYTL